MALFGAAGANAGRTAAVQARLTAIEHELDECFHAVREQRAVRDAERFTNEDLLLRRGIRPIATIAKVAKSRLVDSALRRPSGRQTAAVASWRWQVYGSKSTARSRRSPTTIPTSTTRSTTTWTRSSSRSSTELAGRPEVRAVVWRGEGKSFSSGRDAGSIGTQKTELIAPRADAPRPPRHPAAVGHRRAGDRRLQGLGHGRVLPAGAPVRHPHRGRGHPLPAARADLRRDPRHRRRGRALRDVRARARERPGAHRPDHAGRGGAGARHREPGRAGRRARRDRTRDGRADRRRAGGHREDGPRGDPPPVAAADPRRRWPTR